MAEKTPATKLNDDVLEDGKKKIEISRAFIYRVPEVVRKVNESAYTPILVSIGPFHIHNGKEKHLQSHMKDIKNCYVSEFFGYLGDELRKDGLAILGDCLTQMEESKDRAKGCYAEEVKALNAEMLVVDGCFILELLRRYTEDIMPFSTGGGGRSSTTCANLPQQKKTTDDPIFASPLMRVGVRHDLLLLENQLPFFVLKELFELTLGGLKHNGLGLGDYILNYFHEILEIGHQSRDCPSKAKKSDRDHDHRIDVKNKSKDKDEDEGKCEYDHILHFLHNHYLPPEEEVNGQDNKFMHYASDLDGAAVKFKGNNKFTAYFEFHKWYRNACFHIPTLPIHDSTEIVLRNLIAFEQCRPRVRGYFTSYASLMDRLIETKDDVQVLVEAGVIVNNLGSCKDVSNLFNNLCKEVVLGKFYFLKSCKDAAEYSDHHCSAWLLVIFRYLHRRWSANPSTFIAFCVALLAFLMQVAGFITNYVRG